MGQNTREGNQGETSPYNCERDLHLCDWVSRRSRHLRRRRHHHHHQTTLALASISPTAFSPTFEEKHRSLYTMPDMLPDM